MKTLISEVIFVILVIVATSCQKNDDEVNGSFTTDITGTSISEKYANVPTNFTISLTSEKSFRGAYKLRYYSEAGKGELFINDKIIEENKEIEFSENNLVASYFPLTVGEHRLRFRLVKDDFETETTYAISVQDYSAAISQLSATEDIFLDQPVYIDYTLSQKNNDREFTATLQLIKGSGQVAIVEIPASTKSLADTTVIVPVPANDTTLIPLPRTRSEEYRIKAGINRIYFNPDKTGEHIIRLHLTNSYGYQQFFDFKLNTVIPEFNATATNDTCIIIGREGDFTLKILNPVHNEVFTSFSFKKNSGRVSIDGNEIEENKVFSLLPGEHQGKYMPAATGNAAIEFSIKDQYNKTKKGLMEFNIVKSLINLELQKPSKAFVGEKVILKANINENNYSGAFRGKITTIPAKAGVLKVNGNPYSENMAFKKGDNILELIPNQSGLIRLEIVITDETEISAEGSLELQVSEYEHDLKIDDYNPVINTGETGCISFDVVKPNSYTGKYYLEILQQPENGGKIKLNGKDYTVGKIAIPTAGNQIKFTPESAGEISLNISLYAEDKKVQSKTVTLTSSNNDLNVDISGFKRNILAGQEANLSFSVSKKGYTGTFKYFITQDPAGAGSLKLNGTPYIGEEIETIKNNTSSSISFTPNQSGAVTLNIHVLDGLKETVYPMTYEVSNTPIFINIKDFNTTAFSGKENICQLSIEKAGYTKEFKCEIKTQPENAGKIKVNNYLSDNDSWNIAGGNHVLSFTPNKGVEDIVVNLLITDVYGERSNKTLEYHIKKSALTITHIGNIDASVNMNEGGRFSLAVEKENYAGKYYLETNGKGYKNLKVSGQLYTEKSEIADPQNVGISFFPSGNEDVEIYIRVTDEEGTVAEKKYLFKVNDSNLDLILNGIPGTLTTGKEGLFNFSCKKPGYSGKLKYKIEVIPENAGEFYIEGNRYNTGDYAEINTNDNVKVNFKALKESDAEIRVTIADGQNEISKLFICKIKNTPVLLNLTGFSSNGVLNTENISYLSVTSEGYKGKYKLAILSEPENAGKFSINQEVYNGGEVILQQPENTKITFVPAVSGTVKAILKIANDFGVTATQQLEYTIINPELKVTITEPAITVNQEAEVKLNVGKENYKGDFYAVVTGQGITSLKLNNTLSTGNKIKIFSGSNSIKFIPSSAGKSTVSLKVTVTDEWGIKVEKELSFDVAETEAEISAVIEKQELNVGEVSPLVFTISKENYDSVGYSLSVEPSDAGSVVPNTGFAQQGIPQRAMFTAGKPEQAFVVIQTAGKTKKVLFNIIQSDIDLSFQGFSKVSKLNIGNKCNLSISKKGYTGTFMSNITISPANAGTLKINGKDYVGKNELASGNHSLEFTPSITGPVRVHLAIEDESGNMIEKELVYEVSNSTDNFIVSVNGTDKTVNLNSEASFTFIPLKTGYSGRYLAQISGEGCENFKINNSSYIPGQIVEVLNTSNTVKFTPTQEGEVKINITCQDNMNNSASAAANFTCVANSSDIELSLIYGETNLIAGDSSNFIFTPKGDGLSYELTVTPTNAGKFFIGNSEYSGKTQIESGKSTNITYKSLQAGSAEVKVSVSDTKGNRKDKTIRFEVAEADIQISNIYDWTNKSKILKLSERSEMYISSNINTTCSLTDVSGQPIPKSRAIFYVNGNITENNSFSAGKTPVKLEVEPLVKGVHQYTLNVGVRKYNLYFMADDGSSVLTVTPDIPKNEIIIAEEFNFNIKISEAGTYKGKYSVNISLGSHKIKINGKQYPNNTLTNVSLDEISNLKISFTPTSYSKNPLNCYLKITNEDNISISKNFEFGKLVRDYIEVPAEFVLERQTTNAGTYNFTSDLQYLDEAASESHSGPWQVSVGKAELKLEAGSSTNKVSKKLNPVKIFRTGANLCIAGMFSQNTTIMWTNSPEQQATYAFDVLDADNRVLAHFPIKIAEILGRYSGDKTWRFGSPFEYNTPFSDWNTIKKPGVHIRVHYLLEDTENTPPTETSELKFTVNGIDDTSRIIGKEFSFNVNVEQTGNYDGTYKLRIIGTNVQNYKVNGKVLGANDWLTLGNNEINNLTISASPLSYGKTGITLRIVDQSGKQWNETIELGQAKREYIEVPAEFILERESVNNGTYHFKADLQYHNNLENDYRQVSIGTVDLVLTPGSGTKFSQKLSPVRIFRSSTNEGWLEMLSNSTGIEWTNSPAMKAYYFIEILNASGEILAHYNIKNVEVSGVYSGSKKWAFGSQFESENFIEDWNKVKQPGVHVRIHYSLENTENTPIETSELKFTTSGVDKEVGRIIGEEFSFNVNVEQTGNYNGTYKLRVIGDNLLNVKVNGKAVQSLDWLTVTKEEISKLAISATPKVTGNTSIRFVIKDESSKEWEESFDLGNAERMDLEITASGINKEIDKIIGEEFSFDINVKQIGNWLGGYKIYFISNNLLNVKVNDKNIGVNNYINFGNEIGRITINATPKDYGMTSVKIIVKPAGYGKDWTETIELGQAKREYIEVPAEFVLERESVNNSTYHFRADLQYHNNLENDYRQVSIGTADLTLNPGTGTKLSQKLSPVRIFRSSTNEGWLEMLSNSTVIEWTNSPAMNAYYFIEIINASGEILAHYNIKDQGVSGVYSGSKKWAFGSQFESEHFIEDWNKVKQPGVFVRIHYLLNDTESVPTENVITIPVKFIMEREQTNCGTYIFDCTLDYYNYDDEVERQNPLGHANLKLLAYSDINRLTQPLSDILVYKMSSSTGKLGCGIHRSLIEYKWTDDYTPCPPQKATLLLQVISGSGEVLTEEKYEKNITNNGDQLWIIGGTLWSDMIIPWDADIKRCHVEISFIIENIKE